MAKKPQFILAITTCANEDGARRIIDAVLDKRLAACVNILPTSSEYWWKGKREKSGEVLLFIKSTADAAQRLKEEILIAHTYENPELIILPISDGATKYLEWLKGEVKA